jgi:hypothetical protein
MTVLICEDGQEYSERFSRFLGAEFSFSRAESFSEALVKSEQAQALLLDLDFRRTDPALLIDEHGAPGARQTAEVQGILILRALRARGVMLPALLFADLDDEDRARRLEAELAPLQVISSGEGLPRIAQRLRALLPR